MNVQEILKQLTRDEKIALVAGTDFMYTNPVPRLGIPSIRMSDGPHGLRVQQQGGDNGTSSSEIATCFPTAATTASSWNPQNTYLMGEAMGKEAHHYNINVILGPAVNIKRNPLGGRCFEYFSEDPLLAGKMGCAEVLGIQSQGVGVSVKHFALNNSENYRFMGDSVADMRAIREIYLKPFEMIVKNTQPETLMCAYNKINGEYCSQNKWLLTDVLRKEWGFTGLVMTDWGATHDRLAMLRAGLDLEMPGDTPICRKWIADALENGTLEEEILDKAVTNVLNLVAKHQEDRQKDVDFARHHKLAGQIAEDCAVLLKNDGTLPLDQDNRYFVCGELFEKSRYQGAGSSMINPAFISTPKKAFDDNQISYQYCKGYRENQTETDDDLLQQAVQKAKDFENIVVFAGLTDYVESEGFDRQSMSLPQNQLDLIDALSNLGKKVTVVLYGGSPFEIPFADNVNAMLNMYLPGQNGGEAMFRLLFGQANPSGRLAESWTISYQDVPFADEFGKERCDVYKESIFVGYRYYLTAGKQVRYPFGYGLSYTKFEYSNLNVTSQGEIYKVCCTVKNVGERDGAEVVQLYVKAPNNKLFTPLRELRGFDKVYLKAGESAVVEIVVNTKDLCRWNIDSNSFVLESGRYDFEICSDCQTVELSYGVDITGENFAVNTPTEITEIYKTATIEKITNEMFEQMSGVKITPIAPKRPITLESRFSDMKSTFMGKILYNAVLSVANNDMKKAKKLPEGVERDNKIKGAMMLWNILDSNSIISMSMCSGGHFSYNMAKGFADMANGKIFAGIAKMCKGIKAPALPKNKGDKQ